jgi:hypothetical protein
MEEEGLALSIEYIDSGDCHAASLASRAETVDRGTLYQDPPALVKRRPEFNRHIYKRMAASAS